MTKKQSQTPNPETSASQSVKALVEKVVERDSRLKAAQASRKSKHPSSGMMDSLKTFRQQLKDGK